VTEDRRSLEGAETELELWDAAWQPSCPMLLLLMQAMTSLTAWL
jgi:hypothetical protein